MKLITEIDVKSVFGGFNCLCRADIDINTEYNYIIFQGVKRSTQKIESDIQTGTHYQCEGACRNLYGHLRNCDWTWTGRIGDNFFATRDGKCS